MNISVHKKAESKDREFLLEKLWQYNAERVDLAGLGLPGRKPLDIYMRDKAGNIIGGIVCDIRCRCLEIKILWVQSDHRRKGYGRALVATAEDAAGKLGCGCAMVDTFNFQSPDFYRRCGYSLMGQLDNPQTSTRRYFFKKTLKSRPARSVKKTKRPVLQIQ